ncbi:MAG: GlsB/YeaQ/YmgE family stress response membrane protein [Bacteroidales bacterium]|nr:GlsB/YeaQ/YmgE family stress response membrane protein [Bacteroidales bacterium]
MGIIVSLVLGAVIGWLAGNIMRGGGFGLLWNIIIGVIGSFIGSFVMNLLHVNTGGGIVWQIIVGVIGACLLLWVISLLKKK